MCFVICEPAKTDEVLIMIPFMDNNVSPKLERVAVIDAPKVLICPMLAQQQIMEINDDDWLARLLVF